jgi:Zn finger protein HypA/HybF involved in hydrogenase expression
VSQNSNQTLEFFCPKCNQRLRAANRLAGQRLVCPKCQQNVKVPGIANSQNDDAQWLDLETPALNTTEKSSPEKSSPPATPSNPPSSIANTSNSGSRPTPTKPVEIDNADDFSLEPLTKADRSNTLPKTTTAQPSPPKPTTPPSSNPQPPDDDDLPALAPESTSSAASDFASDLFASIRLDEIPAPATPGSTARRSGANPAMEAQTETHDAEYRITCRTCGTPQYVPQRKQGKSIRCPDCHSEFVVPPPPPNWNPKAKTSKASAKQVDHEVQLAPDSGPVIETLEPTRRTAQEYLSKAEQADIDEQMDNVYSSSDFDSQEFMRRNFLVFRDITVWGYAIALGLSTGISMAVLLALHNMLAGKIPSILIDIGGLAIGVMVVGLHILCGYALVDAGAHRRAKVRFWPLGNMGSITRDGLPVLAASVLSAAPGFLFGAMAILAGVTTVVSMIPMFVSFWALFPVTLLSMLNSETIYAPFSNKVFASFGLAKEEWGTAYFKTGIVSFIAFLVLSVGLTNLVLAVLSGIALPLALFYIYYQTGLLGSSIAQHLDVDIGQSDGDSDAHESLPQ